MMKRGLSWNLIQIVLSDGEPKSLREIVRETGLSNVVVGANLYRGWKKGLILRTKEPMYESYKVSRARSPIILLLE